MSGSVDVVAELHRAAERIVPFAEADPAEWDALVDRSDDGWVYQRHAWINWASTFETRNWSFAIADQSRRLIALLPLYEGSTSANRFLHVTRLRTGVSGPVSDGTLSLGVRRSLWRQLIDVSDHVARSRAAAFFEVKCAMSAPSYWPDQAERPSLREVGLTMPVGGDPFRPSATLDRFIDVDHDDEALLAGMHQNARSAVRQSMRSGLELDEATNEDDMHRYYELHSESWRRTGLAPHPVEYFRMMWRLMRPFGGVRVLFARHEGRDVAGILLHTYKRAAFYWGGCSLGEAQRLRPNNFLIWEAMRALRTSGTKWFELGIFEIDGSVTKSNTVGRFKASFGPVSVEPIEAQRVYRPGALILASATRELKLRVARALRRSTERE